MVKEQIVYRWKKLMNWKNYSKATQTDTEAEADNCKEESFNMLEREGLTCI